MKQRLDYLVNEGTITQEDAEVFLYICKGKSIKGVSLLDLIALEIRLKKYLTSTLEANKRTLYLGFIGLVKKFKSEWGSKSGEQYIIC